MIDTELTREHASDELLERLAASYPVPRLGTALEVAVGTRTAALLLAQMPELGQLNRGEAAALAGLAPFNHDSGSIRGKRAIFGGRRALRSGLYMAALKRRSLQSDPVEFLSTTARLSNKHAATAWVTSSTSTISKQFDKLFFR